MGKYLKAEAETFGLSMRLSIKELIDEILGVDDRKLIDDLSKKILSPGLNRRQGVDELRKRVGNTPQRPLWYLDVEIGNLPYITRNVVRYAGDYIDQLMKHVAHEKAPLLKRFQALRTSLANNIDWSKDTLGPRLTNQLKIFEKEIYTPAKHDFEVKDREHLFSTKDAIATCLITMALAKNLIELSNEAELFSREELPYEVCIT